MRNQVLIFSLLLGPSALSAEELEPREFSSTEIAVLEERWTAGDQEGYIQKANPKLTALWKTKTIPVCWENPTQENLRSRRIVQTAVEESWQLNSALNFSYWGECQSNSLGIRVRVDDVGPHVKRLGVGLSGLQNGMVLNDTFENWSPSCQNMWRSCVYSIAVHEFGHALGFSHEQNRADTPDDECYSRRQGSDGSPEALDLTPWDLSSVMNYCNPTYSNDGILSDWDVYALRKLYGEPNV